MSRSIPHVSIRPRVLASLAVAGALAAAMLGVPGTSAAAQPAADSPQTIVYYNLLDLSTDQNTRALYRRIVNAAQTVCPVSDPRDLTAWDESRTCQRQAIERAVAQIGNPRLAAVHARTLARHG